MLVSYQQPNAMESILKTSQPFLPGKSAVLHLPFLPTIICIMFMLRSLMRLRPFLMLRWLRRLMCMTMNRTGRKPHTDNGSTEYIQQLFHTFTQNKVRQKKAAENINNLCGAGEIRTLVQTRNQSAFYMFIFAFDCREQARPKPPT